MPTYRHNPFIGISICLALLLGACEKPLPAPTEDLPPLTGLLPDPEKMPTAARSSSDSVSVSQILISYRGAKEAYRKVKRSHSQARQRAEHLLVLARSQKQDFADLARRFSDDTKTSKAGGKLGVIGPGELHPDLESAARKLDLGQISAPVESPRGFHLLHRHMDSEAQAEEILISYHGAKRYQPRTSRSKAEAEALAQKLHAQLLAGAPFAQLALSHSDLPNHVQGGVYAIFDQGSQNPQFEEIVFTLPVGGLSAIIETPTGFHIVRRLPVERILLRILRIDYQDVHAKPKPGIPSQEEAKALAESLYRQLKQGADFASLAASHSNGPAKSIGGRQKILGRSQLMPALNHEAFALAPGGISQIIEQNPSFYLLKRVR